MSISAFSPISRRIRNVQRYVQVLEVLIRYGFRNFVHDSRLDSLMERGRGLVGTPTDGVDRLSGAERVRRAMEELGPTYVKMGQVLSTRPDLIPPEWAEEFKKLQDDVPGVEYDVIRAQLEAEFPGRVNKLFKKIEKVPLAAASMAQAHRATLQDGSKIVLKVLRPGIREVTEADMDVLRTLAEIAESHFANLGYSPIEVVNEFARELAREVDMTHEGRATDRLRGYFEDDDGVVFPMVYWEATTKNVLAVEELQGLRLSQLKDSKLSAEDRRSVVENGARAVMRQCLEIGYFHGDPHPGNLFALPGGKIGFIDCGITGQLDDRTTQHLANLIAGVVSGDLNRVMMAVPGLADVPPEKLEDRQFRADLQAIVSEFENVSLERLNLGRMLQEFFGTLRTHHIRCPADLMLLIKALTMIESVARDLDPGFELIPFARPYIEDLVKRRYSAPALEQRLKRSLLHYVELVEDLPNDLRTLMTQLRRNKFAINLEHRGLNRLTFTIEHASRNISLALIIAATLVGSSILLNAAGTSALERLTVIGLGGLVVAALLSIGMVLNNRRFRADRDRD